MATATGSFEAASSEPVLAIGLMSGTSRDGVDAALIRLYEGAASDLRAAFGG